MTGAMENCCKNIPNKMVYYAPQRKEKPHPKCIKICPHKRKKIRYCQPPVPESYAPKSIYNKPQYVMEDKTINKLSYRPINENVKRQSYKPCINLFRSTAKMNDNTVHKLSYLPVPIVRTEPFYPPRNELLGRGPMQNLTTQKHDYVPKPIMNITRVIPSTNLGLSNKPFEDKTITWLSYQPPGQQKLPKSYAPMYYYKSPDIKMECATVQKLSYRPNTALPRWIPNWAKKPAYQKPCISVDSNTVYKDSYALPGWECIEYETSSACDCEQEVDNESNIFKYEEHKK